jgi:hypothetical protein
MIEALVWLLAFMILLACLGKLFDALESLEKSERDVSGHELAARDDRRIWLRATPTSNAIAGGVA